jgi:hypothetical protein
MDGVVNFSHEGIEYSADVIKSENLLPPYYWVLFRNPEMQKKLGDDIAFIEKDGKLISVHPSIAKKNQDLLQAVKTALENYLYKM